VLGRAELDQLLAERERLNEDLQQIIDDQTEPWGSKVSTVEIKDVEIPEAMQRAMARQAQAERERRAKIINGRRSRPRPRAFGRLAVGAAPGSQLVTQASERLRLARRLVSMPLLWRVFATNVAVLVAATLVLVLSPATVSFPVALTEVAVLVAGLTAMLALNLALLRRVFRPLARLTRFMRGVDPLRPGGPSRGGACRSGGGRVDGGVQ
jgi:hypothetical protein